MRSGLFPGKVLSTHCECILSTKNQIAKTSYGKHDNIAMNKNCGSVKWHELFAFR